MPGHDAFRSNVTLRLLGMTARDALASSIKPKTGSIEGRRGSEHSYEIADL
jgi:hypothetical protein